MKKLLAMALVLVMVLGMFAACAGGNNAGTTTKPSTDATNPGTTTGTTAPGTTTIPGTTTNPGATTNPGTTDPSNPDDPTQPSIPDAPVGELQILIVPEELEINAGEEIDLMFGVVANEGARIIIIDDSDFDNETPGVYEITYQAILGDQKVTGVRTITVLEALSNIALEVRNNNLGENKWQGKLISFGNNLYVTLNKDTELKAQSGVFHNTSDKTIVLTVAGTYGCSAVLDKNGVVLEGRDGANSKLVNAKNPTRAGSTATTLTIGGESVTVSSAFAKQLSIPAGGFAIVIQANYAGSTADTDGRGFMNYNVIYEIGNVVRLFWVDTNETLTPYINQAPTVTGNNKILIQVGDTEFDLDKAVIAGIIAKDDNGTFASTDDLTLTDIKIVDKGGFDVNKTGVYTIKLSVSDGKLTTSFTREVEVKSEGVGTLQIGENKMNVALDYVAKDKDLAGIGNNIFIIYTSKYKGEIGYANGFGVAIVVNKYGEIVRIYDGANAKYYDAKNPGGIQDATKCTAQGYLTEAFASLQSGETLIVAPNSTANNAEGGSRKFLLANRTIGAVVSGLGLTFESKDPETDPCEKGHNYVNGVCGNCGAEDPDYDPCAGGHNYVNGVCTRCEAEDPDYVIPDDSKTITIGDKTFISSDWAYNDSSVVATNAATYTMIIYDGDYEGTVALNGYGAAIVLNKYGKLVKIYDAANMGFWTVAGKSTATLTFTAANYATVAFSELAEGELLIIFPNDGGANGNAARGWALGLRNVGGDPYCGKIATLTGFTFAADPCADGHNYVDGVCGDCGAEDPDFDPCEKGHDFKDGKCTRCDAEDPDYVAPGESKVITIVDKTFTALDGKWAYNDSSVVAANAANYSMIIYDGNYTGTVSLNGYGAALVLNKYGQLVKIYDGANVGFWTVDGKAASAGFTAANYATVAFDALAEGEILVVFPNDGGSNAARGWALGLRSTNYLGKVATLTGFEFDAIPTDDKTITIGTKSPLTVVEGKWTYNNANITTGNAATYSLIIFDKSFTGTFTTNGYGAALVINKYGELVKIYDGGNVQFWTAEGKAATPGFTSSNYATVAFEALEDGELLLIFPNDGGSNTARNWALGLRNAPSGPSECGKVITLTGFEFKTKPATDKITIGSNTLAVDPAKVVVDTALTAVGDYAFIVYTSAFEGEIGFANGYGEAIVVNQYGEIVRVYDGANGKYYDADNKSGIVDTSKCTAANYAKEAFASLQDGEIVIIAPNGSVNNADGGSRKFLLSNRTVGAVVSGLGLEFATK